MINIKFLILIIVIIPFELLSQNWFVPNREKTLFVNSDSLILDTLSIVPNSIIIKSEYDSLNFEIDYTNSSIQFNKTIQDSVTVSYKVFPLNFSKKHFLKDPKIYLQSKSNLQKAFQYSSNNKTQTDLLDFGEISSSGSLTRGLTVGNNQDLSLTSNFNLQLSGKLTNKINILASVTDENLPIQPEGNTQQLQDFDQVYIQLYDKKNKLIGGDFNINQNDDYFLKYNKRARGAFFETKNISKDSSSFLNSQASAAISKGKYARNVIQGIEGNQGPYRLRGNENERFIIVLSGTEQIFIDGKLLKRGQEYDYTIDYNSSEITFTTNRLITKDKRITVEFQYSDKNYVRSVFQTKTTFSRNKTLLYIHFYSEQDHKNQSLQQELNDNEKNLLTNIGNNIDQAITEKIDSVGFEENQVRYKKVDSLGYEAYVFSEKSSDGVYQLSFSEVGTNNGDYTQEGFSAFGKIYKWVKPDTIGSDIIHQGNYAPIILLIAPKRKTIISGGFRQEISDHSKINTEISLSNFDENTFSKIGNNQNTGVGFMLDYSLKQKDTIASLYIDTKFEFTDRNYQFIERYRNPEFIRNWNIQPLSEKENEALSFFKLGYNMPSFGNIAYTFNSFLMDKSYQGFKNDLNVNIATKGVKFVNFSSLLNSSGERKTSFFRTYSTIVKNIKKISIGLDHEFENNQTSNHSDSLIQGSKLYNDIDFFVKNSDSSNNSFQLFAGERIDYDPINGNSTFSTRAQKARINYQLFKNQRNQFSGSVNYRKLNIINSTLTPEETFLNRFNLDLSFFKRIVKLKSFYEVGSGLEQKREYIYIVVNSSQGTYAWIDYNNDSIQQIDEFEIALFSDQANYIRTFVPSDEYVKVLTNQFSQSINIDLIHLKSKKLSLFKKLSNSTSFFVNQKNNNISLEENLNPFTFYSSNTISSSRNIQNSLFFNRSGYKYGANYLFTDLIEKTLSSNGFDNKSEKSHSLSFRYRIKDIILKNKLQFGDESFLSDYLSNRDFDISSQKISPSIFFQLKTKISLEVKYDHEEKLNKLDSDYAIINKASLELKIASSSKLSSYVNLSYFNMKYSGEENSPIEYQMLEGLKRGDNFTWEVSFTNRLAKNMDLSIFYSGRKTPINKAIHTGNMQVRAFF